MTNNAPHIRSFFCKNTNTWTYLVADPKTRHCALIDTVLDYDAQSASTTTTSADKLIAIIEKEQLNLEWILETHVHADHMTASAYIKDYFVAKASSKPFSSPFFCPPSKAQQQNTASHHRGSSSSASSSRSTSPVAGTNNNSSLPCAMIPKIAIGEHIKDVLAHWVPVLKMKDCPVDGSQFDVLFKDGDKFGIGSLTIKVIHTPGHTPACVTYILEEEDSTFKKKKKKSMAFVGDTIFMPIVGTARTDFPGGSAEVLYDSCRALLKKLPADAIIHVGHDYPGKDKDPLHAATVAEHIKSNSMMNERVTREEFVEANKEELPVPRLLLPALQVNLRAGRFGGEKCLTIPMNLFNKNNRCSKL